MAFDVYMKQVREKKGVNQTQMAKILGISRTAIKFIENGSTRYPSKKVLENLAEYLEKSKVDVMSAILFDNNTELNENEIFVRYYLTHMYLIGWNIINHPYIYNVWQGNNIEFDGKISKKHQSNNIVIVTTYKRELLRITEVKTKDDALAFIGDFISKLMSVLDKFRSVSILFDFSDTKDRQSFYIFKELHLNKYLYKCQLVLFDSVNDEILERIEFN